MTTRSGSITVNLKPNKTYEELHCFYDGWAGSERRRSVVYPLDFEAHGSDCFAHLNEELNRTEVTIGTLRNAFGEEGLDSLLKRVEQEENRGDDYARDVLWVQTHYEPFAVNGVPVFLAKEIFDEFGDDEPRYYLWCENKSVIDAIRFAPLARRLRAMFAHDALARLIKRYISSFKERFYAPNGAFQTNIGAPRFYSRGKRTNPCGTRKRKRLTDTWKAEDAKHQRVKIKK